jgi:hypothetical protein
VKIEVDRIAEWLRRDDVGVVNWLGRVMLEGDA